MSEQAMTVEIDEAIRRDPELLADVEAATEYLRRLPEDNPTLRLPEVVRWRPGDEPGRLELILSEAGPPSVVSRRQFAASLLRTQQLRRLTVLSCVSDFVSARRAAGPSLHMTFLKLIQNMEKADAAAD